MGEKISTIILKVDLDCRKCYKKISKTICKLQERENIQSVNFDEKNNTVTISGPFDPKKLCKKLCCKASKVIKDIQIKEEKEKPKPKEDKPKPKEDKPKPKEDKPKEDKPKEDKPKPKEDKPKEDKPKPKEDEKPKELQPGPPAPKEVEAVPVFVAQEPESGFQPGGPWPGPGCTCGCTPWYGGYYGDCKCPWCGRGYGWAPECPPQVIYIAPPPPPPPQPCGGYKTCTFICEEDPQSSCLIM